jgi:uncharacterized membrane protein YdfJ with MMPL/SSD domain
MTTTHSNLLDATLARAVLLPATMKLLGSWNSCLPRALRWLPRLGAHPRVGDIGARPRLSAGGRVAP